MFCGEDDSFWSCSATIYKLAKFSKPQLSDNSIWVATFKNMATYCTIYRCIINTVGIAHIQLLLQSPLKLLLYYSNFISLFRSKTNVLLSNRKILSQLLLAYVLCKSLISALVLTNPILVGFCFTWPWFLCIQGFL